VSVLTPRRIATAVLGCAFWVAGAQAQPGPESTTPLPPAGGQSATGVQVGAPPEASAGNTPPAPDEARPPPAPDDAGPPPAVPAAAPAQGQETTGAAGESLPSGSVQSGVSESAEISRLLGSSGDAALEQVLEPQRISIYGFADFAFERLWSDGVGHAIAPHSSFYVGKLNVYLDAQLAEHWRSLSEIRFTYLPHGSIDLDSGALVRTAAIDYSDTFATTRVGSIQIERAWLEYAPARYLAIQAGQWLTPYGIWNVDHGSPALIGIQRPYLIRIQLLPERQTGLQLHGEVSISDDFDLAYYATLSNGRGGIDEYRDLDENKALGGRLELRHLGFTRATLGISAYRGRFTDSESQVGLNDAGTLELSLQPIERFDEQSLGCDLRLSWQGFEVRAEAAMNDRAYLPGLRPGGVAGLAPDPQADVRRWGLYALLGYMIEPLQLMPFVGYEHVRDSITAGSLEQFRAGLRFIPIPSVTLKVEYTHAGQEASLTGKDVIDILGFQAAWAFR